MQSPFRRLSKALRNNHRVKSGHGGYADYYELLAFILVIPSMLVLQVGFVLVASNIWIATQIHQNRFVVSFLSIILCNIVLMPWVFFGLVGSPFEANVSLFSALFIMISLTFVGLKSLVRHKRDV